MKVIATLFALFIFDTDFVYFLAMVEEGGEVRQKVRAEDIAARIKELRDKHQRIADHGILCLYALLKISLSYRSFFPAGKRKRVRASTDAEKESYRIIKMSEHTLRDFPYSPSCFTFHGRV